jgi:hypothetical protein
MQSEWRQVTVFQIMTSPIYFGNDAKYQILPSVCKCIAWWTKLAALYIFVVWRQWEKEHFIEWRLFCESIFSLRNGLQNDNLTPFFCLGVKTWGVLVMPRADTYEKCPLTRTWITQNMTFTFSCVCVAICCWGSALTDWLYGDARSDAAVWLLFN